MCVLGRSCNMKIEFIVCLIHFLVSTLTLAYPNECKLSNSITRKSFPSSFLFGSSSSAYQCEGAAAQDGKTPSVWDTFTQKYPEKLMDHSNGSIAADQYHKYKEDVSIMKDIGFDVYRLSISSPRVLPRIQPVVTLFHWDFPQALEDKYKGFLSPKVVDDFRDYADLCFKKFGDRVKKWITLNEPLNYAGGGFAAGSFAPGRCSNRSFCPEGDSSTEPYIVGHNSLLAHANAVKVYKKKYQASQKGEIGISLSSAWLVPYSNSTKDKLAASRGLAFQYGWFMEPLNSGAYPQEMIDNVGKRLPKFTSNESKLIKGSYNFIGVNYYAANYVADMPCPTENLSFVTDACVKLSLERNGVPIGPKNTFWLYVYPEGLLKLLLYTKQMFNNPKIYITENGVADPEGTYGKTFLDDTSRIEFIQNHLEQVLIAMEKGVRVQGYTVWSLLDSFEWIVGYTIRFGVVHVDFKNGSKRFLKYSASWFKQFLHSTD